MSFCSLNTNRTWLPMARTADEPLVKTNVVLKPLVPLLFLTETMTGKRISFIKHFMTLHIQSISYLDLFLSFSLSFLSKAKQIPIESLSKRKSETKRFYWTTKTIYRHENLFILNLFKCIKIFLNYKIYFKFVKFILNLFQIYQIYCIFILNLFFVSNLNFSFLIFV